jgi:ferritin
MFAQIIPKGRTHKDKVMYKFMNWFLRKNKKEIQDILTKNIEDYYLYGKGGLTQNDQEA